MALQKQSYNIPFALGLDLKTDPYQIPPGKFLSLQNTVFNKGGLLQKRNGFAALTELDAPNLNTITTYNGNLTTIGDSLFAFSKDSEQWINKGDISSVGLSVLPLVRTSTQQNTVDVSISSQGLTCVVWEDSDTFKKYQVIDSDTGQVIVAATNLETGANTPRTFLVGNFFVITYLVVITGTTHLRYIAVPISNLTMITSPIDISTQVSSINAAYDGQSVNGNLFIAWDGSDGGGAVRISTLGPTLMQGATTAIAGHNARLISVCGDTSQSSPIIWLTYIDSSNNGYSATFTTQLAALLPSTQIITAVNVYQITSFATGNVNTVFYETNHTYSFSSVRTDFISSRTITSTGSLGSAVIIERSVGLASKAFQINSKIYMLVAYAGTYQPTYFLIDSTGKHVAKLAYSNGGGYPSTQILSNAIVNGSEVKIGYLLKDQLTSVNKNQTGAVGGIFSQTGLNLATFNISNFAMVTAEIGGALHFASGFLWMYDGVKPVEHGFHLWPEDLASTNSSTGGFLTAQQYFYQVTYEWTDSQGNIHRSAPSIPLNVDLSASMTSTNSVTLDIPTLRVTYKTAPNSVRIMIYRWSTANQQYYQITSIQNPTLNDPSVDSITYVDTQVDSAIIGNALIYTTGGVIENIGAPACSGLTLFKSRLMLIDSEDPNLVWYSKQVIENTPVELSDLLTVFVAPTTGAQGSTGPLKTLSAMDDKAIFFKKDAAYYLTGIGPDNTGANNDFNDPVFITATVGCSNAQSITLMPEGIMFQSDKGIWLLGRDLSSSYIGAAVQDFNSSTVKSALTIPATNQVRFTLDDNITLMYDYYYGQWGTFTNIPAVSSTIYQGLHTFLNIYGQVYQESPGQYLDGSVPVTISFTTGWITLNALQGYQRAYYMFLLGTFLTPHTLTVQVAYDYFSSPVQLTTFTPDNYNLTYGEDTPYGNQSPYGGMNNIEQWRIDFDQQQCQSIQITLNENYNPFFGTVAGAGLTLSGLNLLIGAKNNRPPLSASRTAG